MPQAIPLSCAGGEISFQLPSANKGAFGELFKELEEQVELLNVGSYGVSMTTLEEVFLRLADIKDRSYGHHFSNHTMNGDVKSFGTDDVRVPVVRRDGWLSEKRERSFGRAFKQLFLKRAIIAKRDVKVKRVKRKNVDLGC